MKHRSISSNLSVKWKMFAFFAFFTILMIAVLWLLQTVFIDEFYENIKIKQMKQAADAVLQTDSKELDELAEKYEVSILMMNKDLSVISSGTHYKNGYILKLSPHTAEYMYETAQRLNGEALLEIMSNHDNQPELPRRIVYARIVENKNVVLIESVFSSFEATSQTIRKQLYWVMIPFLIIGMIFALVISKSTSNPIEKINASARKLADGNYNADFNVKGYKEISELSRTLQYASQELSKTENYRRELIANISHDLRTPLTMITAYSEAMRDIPGELTPENVQIIIDETGRLTALVNDLLDLSKLQSGYHMLNRNKYNLTKSLNVLLKRYSKLIEQEGYDIKFEYDFEVNVFADEQKITQVAYNLINNAVNYTGEDKKITIRQIIDDNKVRIEVHDTGQGISDNQIKYIWERYYKTDSIHKRAKQGNGIGLSIVKGIMELHNERYGVSSILKKGSVFWFELTKID